MTAHSAKGLEFPVTIIAAMDKGTQRNSAPVTFTPTFGLGITWNDPAGKKKNSGLDDSWQLRNSEELKEREKQEAHRLLYVAMTRAEEHLILSYSRGKNKPSNWAKIVDSASSLRARRFRFLKQTPNRPRDCALRAPDSRQRRRCPDAGPPRIAGQHDSAVNVTSLAVFADCPRKYYLQRYIGWNGSRLCQIRSGRSACDDEDEADEMTAARSRLGGP